MIIKRLLGFFRDEDACISLNPSICIQTGNPYAKQIAAQIAELGERWIGSPAYAPLKRAKERSRAQTALIEAKAAESPVDKFFRNVGRYEAKGFTKVSISSAVNGGVNMDIERLPWPKEGD